MRWEPIVLTFDYKYAYWREPCCFPCCCCPCCFHPLSCCKDQKTKVRRVHDKIQAKYVKTGVFGKGAIALSFRWQEDPENPDGFKPVEIFRNIDAAEAYYTTHSITGDKLLCFWVLCNLPLRQATGPTAVVPALKGGNVKAYALKPETLINGKGTVMYNFLKLEQWTGVKDGKDKVVEVIPLTEEEATPEALEARFGQFHYGWTSAPSLAETETTMKVEVKPAQQEMK